jgi:Arc/MetJ family transcription regulator
VTKTLIDIDDARLAEAAIALGTATKKDTVSAALDLVIDTARRRRVAALEQLRAMADSGAFDFERLAELDE